MRASALLSLARKAAIFFSIRTGVLSALLGKAMMTIAPYVLGGLLLIALGCALLALARYHGRSK